MVTGLDDAQVLTAPCPACGTKLRFQKRIELGEIIVCSECHTELEVVKAMPLKLDWAYEEPIDEVDLDDLDWAYKT